MYGVAVLAFLGLAPPGGPIAEEPVPLADDMPSAVDARSRRRVTNAGTPTAG